VYIQSNIPVLDIYFYGGAALLGVGKTRQEWPNELGSARVVSRNKGIGPQMNASSNSQWGPVQTPQSSSPAGRLRAFLIGLAWLLVCSYLYRNPLQSLAHLAAHNDNASHIPLIPLLSGWLLYLDRKRLLGSQSFDFLTPLLLMIPAILVVSFSLRSQSLNVSERLTALTLSFVLFLQAGFVALAGRKAARVSWFALALLFLAVPLPDAILDRFIYVLQAGSAAVAEVLFDWTGVPVLREGFIFRLPRMSIEVARECSGIRSSIALLVLAILASHFAFRPFWKKAIFVAAGLVIMVVKNGVRIVTLTLLANYVDPAFLYGKLHHQGGVVFFLLGLGLLLPIYWLLRRGEGERKAQDKVPLLRQ
jgi:exosortase